MKKFWRSFLALALSVAFLACEVDSCCNSEASTVASLKIVCWNTQTFFDGVNCGNEYAEFKKSENWTEESYRTRLKRLCDFVASTDADVYVFEELENEGVLYDVYNQLTDTSWSSKKLWSFGTFTKEPDSGIGIGIISRLPLEDVKLHSMDIRTQKEKQPSGRPILEVTVLNGENRLKLFVNHWKSKASGEGEGEIWRQWQENILCTQLLKASSDSLPQKILVCGDFNKNISDFAFCQNSELNKIHLRGINSPSGVSSIQLYSPWLNSNGSFTTEKGSYYYKENWERIDHFFANENIELKGFRVIDEQPLVTADGVPNAYRVYTGAGYSDHLPLFCEVFF